MIRKFLEYLDFEILTIVNHNIQTLKQNKKDEDPGDGGFEGRKGRQNHGGIAKKALPHPGPSGGLDPTTVEHADGYEQVDRDHQKPGGRDSHSNC